MITEGAFSFGDSGSKHAALLIQLSGSEAPAEENGMIAQPASFDRTKHIEEEQKVISSLLEGRFRAPGSKQEGDSLRTSLTGNLHMVLHARSLLQKRAVRLFVNLIKRKEIQFPGPLVKADDSHGASTDLRGRAGVDHDQPGFAKTR